MAEVFTPCRRPLWRLFWRARAFTSKGPVYALTNLRWRARVLTSGLAHMIPLAEARSEDLLPAVELGSPVSHFRTRVEPVFHFDYRGDAVPLVDADMRARSISAAGDILRRVFHFRGAEISMEPVQWDLCPRGNSDWTRDLNRHFYLVTLGMAYKYTGAPEYARDFVRLSRDWLASNGPKSPAWSDPFEVAARLNAWVWCLYLFRDSPDFPDHDLSAYMRGFRQQARQLAANLEYHIPTNHLLLEAKTLAMCGYLFPEWQEAAGWFRKGMSVLCAEVTKQVCPDGVHGERSILYHKIITSELSELLWLLQRGRREVPRSLWQAYERMVEFELNISRPDGSFPLFSDSATTDGYLRFSTPAVGSVLLNRPDFARGNAGLTEDTFWLLGTEAVGKYRSMAEGRVSLGSRGFPDGGYFVMRGDSDGVDRYMAVDCGPFGLPLVPDHGHADALSFELWAGGRSLIIDSGVYGYNLGEEWRAYFRGTRAHNTMVIDGQDQSLMDGVRHVYRPARSQVHCWRPGRYFDWLDGSHDGYSSLPGPVVHRRRVLFVKNDYWVISDNALGQGDHSYDVLFHVPPDCAPVIQDGHVAVRDTSGSRLAILPIYPSDSRPGIIRGEKDPIQGWISFESGTATPAPVIDFRMCGPAPARFAAVLFPLSPDAERPAVSGDIGPGSGSRTTTAASLDFGPWLDYVMLNLDPPAVPGPGPFHTDGDAGFLRWDVERGRLVRALLIGGSRLIHRNVPVVRASCKVEVLEVALVGEYLEIWADCHHEFELSLLMPLPVKLKINGWESSYGREGSFISFPVRRTQVAA